MPALRTDNIRHFRLHKQRGAALMVMLVLIVIGSAAFLVSALSRSGLQIERGKITSDALAQARDALIGYAVSLKLQNTSAARPGDLPCPDTHTPGTSSEGTSSSGCSGNVIGYLPWKTLDLPDLRDSSGERLWYAVSTNVMNSPRTGTLNSDTPGTLSVRDSVGNIIYNGCSSIGPNCPAPGASDAPFGTGAVAVIIAPGSVLQRQDGTLQSRNIAGANIASNYLDILTTIEDNADFIDATSNGFIQGTVKDVTGKITLVNDQITSITQDNIMQAVQKRVAAEVTLCLNEYALNNNGRYPWAVPLTDFTYHDQSNLLFGRIPDNLNQTTSDSASTMVNLWGPLCNTHNNNIPSAWWQDWREMVFYGLADAYKPAATLPSACGTCLVVTNASAAADKKFVVIVAGKMLATQTNRPINASILSNYLESPNSAGATTFSQGTASTSFNDTLVFQQ